MLNPVHLIDWPSHPFFYLLSLLYMCMFLWYSSVSMDTLFSFSLSHSPSPSPFPLPNLFRVHPAMCARSSWSWNRRKRDKKNARTNLGTVRMEMPCRCYSHLHSDFRYKPLCPRPYYDFRSFSFFTPTVTFPIFLFFVFSSMRYLIPYYYLSLSSFYTTWSFSVFCHFRSIIALKFVIP